MGLVGPIIRNSLLTSDDDFMVVLVPPTVTRLETVWSELVFVFHYNLFGPRTIRDCHCIVLVLGLCRVED